MQDDLDLRASIAVILRSWRTVALVVVVAVAASGLLSFFVINPVYQAGGVVSVVLPRLPEASDSGETALTTIAEGILAPWLISPPSFVEQLKSTAVLDTVCRSLSLDVTPDQLREMVRAEAIKDTNLVRVSVRYHDPEVAAQIANATVQSARDLVLAFEERQMKSFLQTTAVETRGQQARLAAAVDDLQAFLASGPSAEELRAEVAGKAQLLAQYRSQLVSLEVTLTAEGRAIAAAEAELAATPEKLTRTSALIEDPLASGLVTGAGVDPAALARLSLESEEVNPAWVTLGERLAQLRIELAYQEAERAGVVAATVRLGPEVAGLRSSLAERETEQAQLENRVGAARQMCLALLRWADEVALVRNNSLYQSRIDIVSPAEPPLEPVTPRKTLNMGVAAVLGLVCGVLWAFFVEYWRRGATRQPGTVNPASYSGASAHRGGGV